MPTGYFFPFIEPKEFQSIEHQTQSEVEQTGLSYTNLVTTSHYREVANPAVNHPRPLNQTVHHNKNIKMLFRNYHTTPECSVL